MAIELKHRVSRYARKTFDVLTLTALLSTSGLACKKTAVLQDETHRSVQSVIGDVAPSKEAAQAPKLSEFKFKISKEIYEKVPEYPKNGTLREKIEATREQGKVFLAEVLNNIDTLIVQNAKKYDDKVSVRLPSAMLQQPYTKLSQDEQSAMTNYIGIISHITAGGVAGSHDLRNAAIDYLVRNSNPYFHEKIDSHPLALEAELGDDEFQGDPRIARLMRTHLQNGIPCLFGVGMMVLDVQHGAVPNLPSLRETKELSWAMLLATRQNMPFHTKGFRFKTFHPAPSVYLSPHDLGHIANNYLERNFRELLSFQSNPQEYHFRAADLTEKGCHALEGAIVLAGKYEKDMDYQLYMNLKDLIVANIDLLLKADPKKLESGRAIGYEYIIGGHLLQAVLDPQAAKIFYDKENHLSMNASEMLSKHWQAVLGPFDTEKDPDLARLQKIIAAAAQDLKVMLQKQADDPILSIYTVGHLMGGLNKLASLPG